MNQHLLYNIQNYLINHCIDNLESLAKVEKPLTTESITLYQRDSVPSLEKMIATLDMPFSRILVNIIEEKGYDEVYIYKKANIDRKLFSKIKSNDCYQASKRTVLAFCIDLNLNLEECEALLQTAGYALSSSSIFDMIIKYFIVNEKYDIITINEALFFYDLPLLGS